ncbi:MAG TPA: heparinase II/III family protein, partial [Bacteroidota bacterium]|nr:heparinase II/III family protein [Bacteroidota bacterium]
MIFLLLAAALIVDAGAMRVCAAQEISHPRLMTDEAGIDTARAWIKAYPWYGEIFALHRAEVDRFIARRPIFVSPLKQTYIFEMYTCPKHRVELMFEEFRPFEHRCPADTNESYSGGKYDMAWAGWYNRVLATELVWMGLLYNVYGDQRYAEAGREILMKFAELYLAYPTGNTILGPAHVFFGTLSESFWGVDMAYGYDLLYRYKGFTPEDRKALKEKLFYPLALITQQFPETASNRQLWYNNVSAAVGFLYGDRALIDFAIDGKYGFKWQLGSALPESGFWAEWSGYHFVALRGMIHLAEMARHSGEDLYHLEIAGRTMKKMFDAPFLLIQPNYEFPRSKDSGGGSILEYAPFYEVGYAVYRDRKYLGLLNLSHLKRGTQIVGESSAIGRAPEPVSMFDIVPGLPPDTLRVYPEASIDLQGNGFAVLRDSVRRSYLYLDYGIMGGEHGHPDRLQIGYFAGGRNWIVDPLNESYMNPNLQLWFHRSIAHNTLVVDQSDQTWTNGHGNFFGALPSFQAASGGSTTEYHGITLTRTLIQAGDYFIDLFDAEAPEVHTYDLPLHGFGELTIDGLRLERQPNDLFGNRPGIQGYDQLNDIYQCRTDSAFQGVFTDKGSHLMVRVIGEPASQVLQAMAPPLGGFYKQMVADRVPVPVLMTRRLAKETRFASLIHAYDGSPAVDSFVKGTVPGSYVVGRGEERDLISADVRRSAYSIVRERKGAPSFAAGFNVTSIRNGADTLVSSPFPMESIQCDWTGRSLSIATGGRAAPSRMRVRAPHVESVSVNGASVPFRRDGGDVLISESGIALGISSPAGTPGTALYIGMRNAVNVRVSNNGTTPVEGRVAVTLSPDWSERTQSQLSWWGGIVNLVATNKGPVERRTIPSAYRKDASWINGIASEPRSFPPGASGTITLNLDVPPDAPPVTYMAAISFGGDTLRRPFIVTPPVTASLSLPNARKEMLSAEFTNRTPDTISVSADLKPDPSWTAAGSPGAEKAPVTGRRSAHRPVPAPGGGPVQAATVALEPFGTKRVDFPIRISGYTKENQLYPVRLGFSSGGFVSEIVHDFYVGVAHFARTAPSLDGSWKGWDRQDP